MLPGVTGLTSTKAQELLLANGPNVLPEKSPPSNLAIFISQFKNPLVYVLVIAGAATLFLGHPSDALIILAAVLINALLGFFQESKASKALAALKKFLTPRANVVRDGRKQNIDAKELVIGDIVVLAQGDKVPADGRLIYTNRLFIEEAILTGESMPVSKNAQEEVYAGTTITSGQGFFRVTKVGTATKIGGLAEIVQAPSNDTPLKKQIVAFSNTLVVLVLTLTLIVFVIGILRGSPALEMFKTAVALAVSAIPEGLLISLTVVLALGMQRILKRRGLVRNLTSAETLGGVTTICADKTGTLTEGKMKVVSIIGDKKNLAEQAVLANDLDDPIVVAAYEWGKKNTKIDVKNHIRMDSIPFSSKERFFASLHEWEGSKMLFVNGAPESLLRWSKISASEHKEYLQIIEKLTSGGKRLIGLARKKVGKNVTKISAEDVRADLDFVGIIAFSDPPRVGVSEALRLAQSAGIKIVVITGDFSKTAVSVMQKLGLSVKKDEVITGSELERLDSKDLLGRINSVKLFARTTPEQKLKIVEVLKAKGEIVAMMGDGVNDAPALNKADIGIVVSSASDVSKESSDLILLDSNFSTVVASVEEGRGIFENIRKIILYLLSGAFAEIVTVVGAILLGLPLPVTAVQILWINLVSDGFPSLALTIDPRRSGIMNEIPRDAGERVVSSWMKLLIMIVSVSSGLVALGYFYLIYKNTGDLQLARSVAFLVLGVNSLIYVFSVRSLTVSIWEQNPFANKWLLVAAIFGFVLQSLPFWNGVTREFFQVGSLDINHWILAFVLSFFTLVLIEVFKLVFKLLNFKGIPSGAKT